MSKSGSKQSALSFSFQADDLREWKIFGAIYLFVKLLEVFGVSFDENAIVERLQRWWRVVRFPFLIVFASPFVSTFVLPWLIGEVARVDHPSPFSIKESILIGIVAAGLWWANTYQNSRQDELNREGEKVLRAVLETQTRIDPDVPIDEIVVNADGSMVIEFKPGVDIDRYGDEIAEQLKIVSENAVRASWEPGTRPDSIRVTTHIEDLPTMVEPDLEMIGKGSEDHAWLGVNSAGEPLVWDFSAAVHGLVTGETGGGKGILARLLLVHARLHGWKIRVVDPKGGNDYAWLEGQEHTSLSTYRGEPTDLYGMAEELQAAREEMYRRNRLLNRHNDKAAREGKPRVENWRQYTAQVDPDAKRMLILVDEARAFRDLFATNDPEWKDELGELWTETVTNIQRVASLARSLGIHLIVMTQRGDCSSLGGATVGANISNNLAGRIVCGSATPTSMRMGLGIEENPRIKGLTTPGRVKYRRLDAGLPKVETGQAGYVKLDDVLKIWPELGTVRA